MMKGVSIILCCYNSSLRLHSTLYYLSKQICPDIFWEIILVDNNSSDGTSSIAITYWDEHGLDNVSLKIVSEQRPGLSFARNTGVKCSKYDFVIFCDDDNWLEQDYVREAYNIMQYDNGVGAAGGLNTAVADIKFPDWFASMQDAYACGSQALVDGEVWHMHVSGAGMVLRKELFTMFEQINFKSQLTDRMGDELSSGGDSEICFTAKMLGFKIIYSSKLKLQHYMENKRLNWNYFVEMAMGHSRSGYKLQYYHMILRGNPQYRRTWTRELIRATRQYINRNGLAMIYYYFKSKSSVSERYKVNYMMEFEKYLTHFKMIHEYKFFILELEKLHFNANILKK